MTQDEKRTLIRHMRIPAISFVMLLALLAVNVTLGATLPFHHAWMVEVGVTVCMVLVVLLLSMDVLHETPLVRVFAGVGFFWVAMLFGMALTDYLAR